MRFIGKEKVVALLLPLMFTGGFSKAWGDTFILPPNEQSTIYGDQSLPSKQMCRLDSIEATKAHEIEPDNVITFESIQKTTRVNGMQMPEGTLMTLVSANSLENEFIIELEPQGQLAFYNDSNLHLTMHCSPMQ